MICIVRSNSFSFCSHLPRHFQLHTPEWHPRDSRSLPAMIRLKTFGFCFPFLYLTHSSICTHIRPHFGQYRFLLTCSELPVFSDNVYSWWQTTGRISPEPTRVCYLQTHCKNCRWSTIRSSWELSVSYMRQKGRCGLLHCCQSFASACQKDVTLLRAARF